MKTRKVKVQVPNTDHDVPHWATEQAYKNGYAKGVKEFALQLQANITINNTHDGYLDLAIDYGCLMEDINDLVKEMVGADNG